MKARTMAASGKMPWMVADRDFRDSHHAGFGHVPIKKGMVKKPSPVKDLKGIVGSSP
jgi:hypothetical protein